MYCTLLLLFRLIFDAACSGTYRLPNPPSVAGFTDCTKQKKCPQIFNPNYVMSKREFEQYMTGAFNFLRNLEAEKQGKGRAFTIRWKQSLNFQTESCMTSLSENRTNDDCSNSLYFTYTWDKTFLEDFATIACFIEFKIDNIYQNFTAFRVLEEQVDVYCLRRLTGTWGNMLCLSEVPELIDTDTEEGEYEKVPRCSRCVSKECDEDVIGLCSKRLQNSHFCKQNYEYVKEASLSRLPYCVNTLLLLLCLLIQK